MTTIEERPEAAASDDDAGQGPSAPGTDDIVVGTIRLRPQWDATLSYELLDLKRGDAAEDASDAIFVGREDLLGGLSEAIADPGRRGTYLISGYRGAGKTSLLIEAARRAKRDLRARGYWLLPIVLNVSEVSASLDTAGPGAARTLTVDARRLLTAMFRQLDGAGDAITATSSDAKAVVERIHRGHRKAGAAQYSERQRGSTERTRSEQSARSWSFQSPDVLKAVAAVAGLVAIALAGWAIGRTLGVVTAAAAGLTGLAVLSYTHSRSVSKAVSQQESAEEDITFDNSLHRLESDLKDILSELRVCKFRTIVVLEELDKLPEDAGDQLDRVIRYFKNLFTQAPALFFFLTDREYYDLIARRIAEARSKRTYAIEHTFFTSRLFVRRPAAEDCLAYLDFVFVGDDGERILATVRTADASMRTRSLAAMKAPGERFVRSLLFLAQDHMFDLKNEIRRYVRVNHDDGSFWVDFGPTTFGANEQDLAPFQFLLEQKLRSHLIPGGREYADEVLRDCVSAVFADLGSTIERESSWYYPVAGDGADELTPSIRQRIVDAVNSTVRDLVTGGAVEERSSVVDGRTTTVITWLSDGASKFRPPATLEPHELTLVGHYDELARDLERLFGPDGRLRNDGDLAVVATNGRQLREELAGQRSDASQAPVAKTAEAAAAATRDADRKAAGVMDASAVVLRERLDRVHGITLVQPNVDASPALWSLAPRSMPLTKAIGVGRGRTLVVFGTDPERRSETVRTVRAMPTATPVAVVVVDFAPAESGNFQREWNSWRAEMEALPEVSVMMRWLPIDAGFTESSGALRPDPAATATWGEALADEIVRAALWTERDQSDVLTVAEAEPTESWLRAGDGTEKKHATIVAAVNTWSMSNDRVLGTPGGDDGPSLEQLTAALTAGDPVLGPTAIVLPLDALTPPSGDRLLPSYEIGAVDRFEPTLARLVAHGEVVTMASTPPDATAANEIGARVITDLWRLPKFWPAATVSTIRSVPDAGALDQLLGEPPSAESPTVPDPS